MPDAMLKKPDALPPEFMKPEDTPLPEFPKPDDGFVVEFPKPGSALMSMPVNAMGSATVAGHSTPINGPARPTGVPMFMPMKGRPIVR